MLNRIILHGRLTRDPEIRYTQSQVPVASFTIAVDRDYTDQAGERGVDFVDCVSWKQGAEFVSKYFRKGQLILVEGRLQSRKWTDKDNNKRTSWEVVTSNTYFGEPKRDDSRNDYYGNYQQTPSSSGNPYSPPPSSYSSNPPQQQYQQQTFTDLQDDDGELPF